MSPTGRRGGLRGKPSSQAILKSLPIWALLALLVLGTVSVFFSRPVQGQQLRTIAMGDIFFDTGSFSVEPGENVTVRVVNGGVLRHTFTLFSEANAQVPVDNNVALQDFYTRSLTLVDVDLEGGQEATVTFTVPMTEGVYTFVCIVPGHSVGGMHGLMFVGMAGGGGNPFGGIGIVQGLLIIALIGVAIFVIIYQIRSTRP